jgi:hypothetical protein
MDELPIDEVLNSDLLDSMIDPHFRIVVLQPLLP